MSTILELTSAQLKQAADIKDQIEALNQELNALLGSSAAPVYKLAQPAYQPAKKGGMSAAGKARIAAAQRARWAKVKAEKPGKSLAVAVKPAKKRGMSAAGKARIIAAQKLRWAKVKAAKAGVKAAVVTPARKKRTMSPAARAAIAAAAKARWARAKAAGKSSL